MQKGQPTARFIADENDVQNQTYGQTTPSGYAQAFSAGFEAGRRASLAEGTQQRTNGQRLSAGAGAPQQQSQGNRGLIGARQNRVETNKDAQKHFERRPGQEQTHSYGVHVPPGRLSDGFQARRSLDEPSKKNLDQTAMARDAHIHNREHEMNGQITNPEKDVRFNSHGHY